MSTTDMNGEANKLVDEAYFDVDEAYFDVDEPDLCVDEPDLCVDQAPEAGNPYYSDDDEVEIEVKLPAPERKTGPPLEAPLPVIADTILPMTDIVVLRMSELDKLGTTLIMLTIWFLKEAYEFAQPDPTAAGVPINKIWLSIFFAFFIFRYTKTVAGMFTYNMFKPKPIAEMPKFLPRDVSVIVPTCFKTPHELLLCLQGISRCGPARIFVVTSFMNVPLVHQLLKIDGSAMKNIRVLGVAQLNKRLQLLRALEDIKTPITVLADDDVFWPSEHGNYLQYLLAVFEDEKVGAGGTRQRVRRHEYPGIMNFLGICYLERRVWNNALTNAVDGSISTLSGRTAAYRTKILNDANGEFKHYFTNDTWRGKPLNSDDDKCLTRYVYSHGWQISLQFDERSILETTVEGSWEGYKQQCLRWARAHWRGNFTVMENEDYWCSKKFLWGCYVIYLGQFHIAAMVVDPILVGLLHLAVDGTRWAGLWFVILGSWIAFTKVVKLIPHFQIHPDDLQFLPAMVIFSYVHGFINIWAIFTMTTTHWGSKDIEGETKNNESEDDQSAGNDPTMAATAAMSDLLQPFGASTSASGTSTIAALKIDDDGTSVIAAVKPDDDSTSVIAAVKPDDDSTSVIAAVKPDDDSTSVIAAVELDDDGTSIIAPVQPADDGTSIIALVKPADDGASTAVMSDSEDSAVYMSDTQ